MKRFFVTGVGTDIGKTFLTAALTWQLRKQGKQVLALKPVASGFDEKNSEASDSAVLLRAMEQPITHQAIAAISPWRFAAPLSPDMAAAREGRSVPLKALAQFCDAHKAYAADYLLIEGAGGVMTPVNETHSMLDWMALQNCKIILVTGTYLGSISHTLTALAALLARGLHVQTVVINTSANAAVSAEETRASLAAHAPGVLFTITPRFAASGSKNIDSGFKHMPDVTSIVTG